MMKNYTTDLEELVPFISQHGGKDVLKLNRFQCRTSRKIDEDDINVYELVYRQEC